MDEALMSVNPGKGDRNCGACAIAYEMRRRGIDVEARLIGINMITLKEAYFIAKRNSEYSRLNRCNDAGDCWTFGFVPRDYDPADWKNNLLEEHGGGGILTVDKDTGRLWEYFPARDGFGILGRQKAVPLTEFTGYDAEFEAEYMCN